MFVINVFLIEDLLIKKCTIGNYCKILLVNCMNNQQRAVFNLPKICPSRKSHFSELKTLISRTKGNEPFPNTLLNLLKNLLFIIKFIKEPKDVFDNEKCVGFFKIYSITFNIRTTPSL